LPMAFRFRTRSARNPFIRKRRTLLIKMNHYTAMFLIMLLSGALTTMNLWADKLSDFRWSINDVYMKPPLKSGA
jgi:hypothetical protein